MRKNARILWCCSAAGSGRVQGALGLTMVVQHRRPGASVDDLECGRFIVRRQALQKVAKVCVYIQQFVVRDLLFKQVEGRVKEKADTVEMLFATLNRAREIFEMHYGGWNKVTREMEVKVKQVAGMRSFKDEVPKKK